MSQLALVIDLNVCVWNYEKELLSDWINSYPLVHLQEWAEVRNWCNAWCDPKLPFNQLIPNIWLLYDIYDGINAMFAPWVYIGFRNLNVDIETNFSLFEKALAYFPGNFSADCWKSLRLLYSKIPPGCYMPAFGVLHKRGMKGIRVGVRSFHHLSAILDFLQEIKWPGDLKFVQQYYGEIIGMASHCDLSLTVGDSIYPQLGLECYLSITENRKHATSLLDALMDLGICDSHKAKALINWIGTDDQIPNIWYTNPNQSSKFQVRRWLLEFKLIYEPGQPPAAKAYLMYDRKSND